MNQHGTMEQATTTQSENELIARFLGFTQQSYTPNSEKMWCDPKHGLPVGELKFDTSWDWLIPVVSRCRPLWLSSQTDLSAELMAAMFEGNIQKTYTALVKFIKYHNLKNH